MDKEPIDNTFVEATEIVNNAYEQTLDKLCSLGEYLVKFSMSYKDVDGKCIQMRFNNE